MKAKIRIDNLNMTLDNWHKLYASEFYDKETRIIELTPDDFIDTFGITGGEFLTDKINDEERIFFDRVYAIHFERRNSEKLKNRVKELEDFLVKLTNEEDDSFYELESIEAAKQLLNKDWLK